MNKVVEELPHINKSLQVSKYLFKCFLFVCNLNLVERTPCRCNVEPSKSENFVKIKRVIQIEVESRSEFRHVPGTDVNVVRFNITNEQSKPIEVVSIQRLLEELVQHLVSRLRALWI